MNLLDKVSCIAVVVASLLFGSFKFRNAMLPTRPQKIDRPDELTSTLIGKHLLPSNTFKAARSARIVLVLSTHCRFCEASMPFYRRLITAAQASPDLAVVALVLEGPKEGAAFLSRNGIEPERLEDIQPVTLVKDSLRATPTVLVLNRSGIVTRVWVGALDKKREQELASTIQKEAASFVL